MTQSKILVVDDEPLIRLDLAGMIEDMGYLVFDASGADEAIRMLESNADILGVVTDVDMPGTMDGRGLVRTIRNRWPPCHLIVVSGHHRLGADELPTRTAFISKPVPARALAQTFAEMGM